MNGEDPLKFIRYVVAWTAAWLLLCLLIIQSLKN